MPRSWPQSIEPIYRYPVKGLSPEAAAARDLAAGKTLPADRLYAIENGPSGFDPAAPGLLAEDPLPDADAQRAAGARCDTALRRRQPHADDPRRTAARSRAATCARRRAARRSSSSSPLHAPTNCAGRRRCCARAGPQLLRRRQEGGLDHQSGVGRGAGDRGRRAGRSAALSRQCLRRAAGRPGTSSICSARRSRSATARLKVVKRIVRCAATNVDPDTGMRDLAIPEHAAADLRPHRLRRLCAR